MTVGESVKSAVDAVRGGCVAEPACKTFAFRVVLKGIDWKGDETRVELRFEMPWETYDSKKVMKALNDGKLEDIPKPFTSSLYRGPFTCTSVGMHSIAVAESEPVFGTVKYVSVRDGGQVEKWEYVA